MWLQHQREKWHCGQDVHNSNDHTILGTTDNSVISPEQGRCLAKIKMIYLVDQILRVENGTIKTFIISDGSKSTTKNSLRR